jgi:hypothetical protein
MRAALQLAMDRWLGRGDAAITVPPMDGPFKPNRLLDEAEVIGSFAAPQDLASDGETLWLADGARILNVRAPGEAAERHVFPGPVTALAHVPRAGLVAVVGGSEIATASAAAGWRTGPREIAGVPLCAVNALCACADGSLLATEGSAQHGADWARDLMTLGRTGRLLRLTPDGSGDAQLATGLRHAFGALELNGRIWASESWAHRVFGLDGAMGGGGGAAVIDRLPAYPSRLAPAAGGGAWLTLFAARTRLVEFVLREPEYRRRMVAEVDPRHWVAPALSSGHSFLEPLQGGAVKQLGIVKPWAPPRSYGLVMRLNGEGLPTHSLHSRADGIHHGIVSVAEAGGWLYVLSKGSGRLLRLKLDALAKEER